MKHSKYELVFIVFSSFSAVCAAQNIPDAGSLMRQTEQMLRQEQMQRNAQRREAMPPAATLTESTIVTAQRFKFHGNKLLATEQLQKVAAPYANRPLNQHELQQLTNALFEAYRQTGWIVQVYIPRQDLTGTELVVQILENTPSNMPSR